MSQFKRTEVFATICKGEPKAKYNLEGYNKGESYFVEIVQHEETQEKHARIYHTPDYYETCSVNVANTYFKLDKEFNGFHEKAFNYWKEEWELTKKYANAMTEEEKEAIRKEYQEKLKGK